MGPSGIDRQGKPTAYYTHIARAFVGTKEGRKLPHVSLYVQEIKRHKQNAGEEILQHFIAVANIHICKIYFHFATTMKLPASE